MRFSIIKIKALLVCSVLGIATLLVAACTVSAQGPKLIYGQQYRIQDGYNNWSGGYLDTNNFCSSRWPGASLCVSTSQSPDRAGMHTPTWTIRSASGKRDGDVVRVGEGGLEARARAVHALAPSPDGGFYPRRQSTQVFEVT